MSTSVSDLLHSVCERPTQAVALDDRLSSGPHPISESDRLRLWESTARTLTNGPAGPTCDSAVGLLLGRIQSGKTTAMTTVAALAHDLGFRLFIAVLGSTNLLLSQNTRRMSRDLGFDGEDGENDAWVIADPVAGGRSLGSLIEQGLARDRAVFVPILKHAGRLRTLNKHLKNLELGDCRTLILDDEADQASLNTRVRIDEESPTYQSLIDLTESINKFLYLQITATPFAPLLIKPRDELAPSFVEVLEPGDGYTGAHEFFIDKSNAIVRPVHSREALSEPPNRLADGLQKALANFLCGAALLLHKDTNNAPVTMLVHASALLSVHERLAFLLQREINSISSQIHGVSTIEELPPNFLSQETGLPDLWRHGADEISEEDFLWWLRRVIDLVQVSEVNSASEQSDVDWAATPVHVLVGGNKLDRGFTIEGLTVSYLSRSTSSQLDTLVQRGRAFGYRREYLAYCRFFATGDTIAAFRGSVETDEDMRHHLRTWLDAGRALTKWADHVGFVIPDEMVPTRVSVVPQIARIPNRGWHMLSNPDPSLEVEAVNDRLLGELGLFSAPYEQFGRLNFRTLKAVSINEIARLVTKWSGGMRSGWSRVRVPEFLERVAEQQKDLAMDVVLMTGPGNQPRIRSWNQAVGFSNLMQGRDHSFKDSADQYGGDRSIFPSKSGLQVHYIQAREAEIGPLHTLVLHIGNEIYAATEVRRG